MNLNDFLNKAILCACAVALAGPAARTIAGIYRLGPSMKKGEGDGHTSAAYAMRLIPPAMAFVFVSFLILNPLLLDSRILLEKSRESYWQWLGRVNTAYVDGASGGDGEASEYSIPHCIAQISKEGFAGVSHEDLRFYLKTMRYRYPHAKWSALRFADGTGIEFPGYDISKAVYGVIASGERVDKETGRPLKLGLPLAEQIDGLTEIRYRYDEQNNPVYELHLDKDGNAAADSAGVAEYYREYDINGNVIWEKRLGTDGLPAANGSGTAEFRKEYDGKDLLSEAYFDGNGNAVNLSDKLYSRAVYVYDDSHNVTGESYFDNAGSPVLTSRGYASVKREFDDKHVTREAYFGINGDPVLLPAGYASYACTYDGNGRMASTGYYGTDSKPAMIPGGYASLNRTYDGAGNAASESFYGPDGKPCICNKGYAAVRSLYDAEKNIIEQEYLDGDGNPINSAYGYAKVRRTYDGGHILTEAYFGEDGNPMVMPGGYSSIRQKWEGDSLIEREYLDDSGMPVEREGGYSKATWAQQDNGVWNVSFEDLRGNEVKADGLNLVKDVKSGKDGWSEWMEPNRNAVNSCFNIGSANLGTKAEGDLYTCSIEIEFKDVEATGGQEFRFSAQGAQDGGWATGNVWNGNLISLAAAPENGIYKYSCTSGISGEMASVSRFDVGFRCDYWSKGKFRVRNVKIEKGDALTPWSPGI